MSLRPVRLRAMAAAVGLVCLPTLGCSWITVNKPPPGPIQPTPPLECTTSGSAPEVDFITQTVLGLGGLAVTGMGIWPGENSSIEENQTTWRREWGRWARPSRSGSLGDTVSRQRRSAAR